MRRYVLTGAPGVGKTAVLRVLRQRGFAVVEEAATDAIRIEQERGIDEPWLDPGFVDTIVTMQRQRQEVPATGDAGVQVYDRSPLCTLALARYLGHPVTPLLAGEVERIARERVYERTVFMLCPLGFVEPTAARRISYQDSVEFGELHRASYLEHGFELIDVSAAPVIERADQVEGRIRRSELSEKLSR